MTTANEEQIRIFTENATRASARVYAVADLDQALATIMDILETKPALIPQMETETAQSRPVLAAPDLGEDAHGRLADLCRERDITLVRENLRDYPQGIDAGLTHARYALADTGTLVVESQNEDVRLASMISEFHIALISPSQIRRSALDMVDELAELTTKPGSYTAFITGPSRTADIERVLAIGVHGPLELHILLLEEAA